MKRFSYVGPLTALAALLAAGGAWGAEWHRAGVGAQGVLGAGSPRAAAEGYLAAQAGELRLSGVKLDFQTELAVGGHRTVRFTQSYAGLPVLGRAAAVRVGAQNEVKVAVLSVARGLSVSPTPSIDAATAIAAVEVALGEGLTEEPQVALAVQPQDDGPGRLVYAVGVLASTRRAAEYLVDAHSGEIVRYRPVALDALGRVYPVSSAVTPQTQDLPLTDMVISSPQRLNGWSGNLTVTQYAGGSSQSGLLAQQSLGPNVGQDFLYNPPADPTSGNDSFAQVSVYYHLTRARDYFASTHALNMSSQSWKLTAVANAHEDGQPMDNAYFSPMGIGGTYASPNLIAIGQGSAVDFAVDSDVFIHEFGHYVTSNAVDYNQGQFAFGQYGLTPWGGAIDEGISDYFACSVNGDNILGEASLAPFGAQRDLSDTTRRCPDDTVGEVHEDGLIIGSLSWSIRGALGADLADRLVWGAITLQTPDSTLGDFATGLQQTAADYVASGQMTAQQAQTVDGLIASRGLDDCDNVLDVTATKPRRYIALGLTNLGYFFGASCGQLQGANVGLHSLFHFRVSPNPGDTAIRFIVDHDPAAGGEQDWGIYVRAGSHLGVSDQTLMPTGAQYTALHFSGSHGELVIDANSNPPFNPSTDYYMVIGDQSCPPAYVTVSTDSQGPTGEGGGNVGGGGNTGGGSAGGGPPGTGGGSGGNDSDDSGDADGDGTCGCRVAGGAADAPWAALAGLGLAAAAIARRRARRGAR
ncbi:MAG: hypothetical protein IT372_24760 [Polyangiaceae bacterium]|nr:hypothetical protein [Polyangiaceae bacterium]